MMTESTDRRIGTRHVGMLYPRPETSGSCRVAPKGRGGQIKADREGGRSITL